MMKGDGRGGERDHLTPRDAPSTPSPLKGEGRGEGGTERRAEGNGGNKADPGSPDITIVHAQHDGNWNPEPLALEVFARWHAGARGAPVRVVEHPLSDVHRITPRPELVVVNGIDAHTFSGAEREAIAAFVKAGGVILFETPGGRGGFARSARSACAELLGDAAGPCGLVRDGRLAARVTYRPYTQEVIGARDATPRLRGMAVHGRTRLLFSDLDLSFGLLDQPCWGVAGYAPESARRLLAEILRYAAEE